MEDFEVVSTVPMDGSQGLTTRIDKKTGGISTGLSPAHLEMLQANPERFSHFLFHMANETARYFGVDGRGLAINTASIPFMTVKSDIAEY